MILKLLNQAAFQYFEHKMPRWAASITFFILLALAPLLVFIVSILQIVLRTTNASQELFSQISPLIPAEVLPTLQLFLHQFSSSSQGIIGLIISTCIIAFTASGMMLAIQDALHVIWLVQPLKSLHRTIIKRTVALFLILLMAAVIGALSIASVLTSIIATWLRAYIVFPEVLLQVGNMTLFILAMTLMLFVLIRALSNVKIPLQPALLGAVTITILLYLGQSIFAYYIAYASRSATGAIGSIFVLMLWVYYSTQVFLFGVELINATVTSGSYTLQPASGYEFVQKKSLTISQLTPLQKFMVSAKTVKNMVSFGMFALHYKKKLKRYKFWSK